MGCRAEHLKDLHTASNVRPIDSNLPVETARTEQGGVQNVRPVKGGLNYSYPFRVCRKGFESQFMLSCWLLRGNAVIAVKGGRGWK